MSGFFITFEGIDRCGKTTQTEWLTEVLGDEAVLVREPGGTDLSERVREILLDPDQEILPRPEALLYAAARAALVEDVIRPALTAGKTVICDRFTDSSLAYQGAARGLGIEQIGAINGFATAGLWPDLTILIELAAEHAAHRRGDEHNRLEEEGVELQRKVAAAYDELARRDPERIVKVDGHRAIPAIQDEILAIVEERRRLRR